jgi:hypothetical protein
MSPLWSSALPIALVLACTFATRTIADDADAQLMGASSTALRVLIRKIDQGPILWGAPLKPATKASIAAGEHTISVMCEVHKSGGVQMMLPGSITITLEARRIYDLFGEPDTEKLRCVVTAKARS